mmetsp:Transcript_5564/g.12647  ORF Transcript_5564/g.12647 Transcript_5564/m.12647 type:complete len:510 (+) Transcript_5564:255-1784(+)
MALQATNPNSPKRKLVARLGLRSEDFGAKFHFAECAGIEGVTGGSLAGELGLGVVCHGHGFLIRTGCLRFSLLGYRLHVIGLAIHSLHIHGLRLALVAHAELEGQRLAKASESDVAEFLPVDEDIVVIRCLHVRTIDEAIVVHLVEGFELAYERLSSGCWRLRWPPFASSSAFPAAFRALPAAFHWRPPATHVPTRVPVPHSHAHAHAHAHHALAAALSLRAGCDLHLSSLCQVPGRGLPVLLATLNGRDVRQLVAVEVGVEAYPLARFQAHGQFFVNVDVPAEKLLSFRAFHKAETLLRIGSCFEQPLQREAVLSSKADHRGRSLRLALGGPMYEEGHGVSRASKSTFKHVLVCVNVHGRLPENVLAGNIPVLLLRAEYFHLSIAERLPRGNPQLRLASLTAAIRLAALLALAATFAAEGHRVETTEPRHVTHIAAHHHCHHLGRHVSHHHVLHHAPIAAFALVALRGFPAFGSGRRDGPVPVPSRPHLAGVVKGTPEVPCRAKNART